jgi:hypothetical protein
MDEKIISHITPADGNVFLDLGFPPDEAARLKAESDAKIDEERARRAQGNEKDAKLRG